MLLPRIPDAWLDNDSVFRGISAAFGEDDTNSVNPGASGVLAASGREKIPTSALNLLMEPHEIAAVPGLPDHVYGTPLDDSDQHISLLPPPAIGFHGPIQVAEAGFLHSPPAVGPRMEHRLPPEYNPENGFDAFGRALANGVTA